MAITIDGAGTITGLDADGISSQPVFAGQVLQVVQNTVSLGSTANFQTNTTSYVNSGLITGSITPTSANSKIWIEFSGYNPHVNSANGNKGGVFKIYRSVNGGSYKETVLSAHQEGYFSNSPTTNDWIDFAGNCKILDTPLYSIGNSISYQLWYRKSNNSTNDFYAHHGSGIVAQSDNALVKVTLMEIAG